MKPDLKVRLLQVVVTYSNSQISKMLMKFKSSILFAMLTIYWQGMAFAQVRLITEEEAKAPSQQVSSTRAITRGPGVKLLTPANVTAKSFAFKLMLEPRGGASLNATSLRVEYLKHPPIDLTSRVQSGLVGNTLEMSNVTVPTGEHPLRVSIRDSEGREGSTVIHLNAK